MFHYSFGRLVRTAFMSGLGLSAVALPAHAGSITWAFGENASIANYGYSEAGTANASYTSVNSYLGEPNAGINSTLTASATGLTYSPNPAPAGLSAVGLNLSSDGAAMNVSASMASGTTHMYSSTTDAHLGNCCLATNAASTVRFQDDLTFYVTGGGSDTVTFNFSLDGNINGGYYGPNYSMVIQENFGGGLLYWDAGSGGGPPTTSPTSGWNTFSFTNNTLTGFNFTGTLTVTNGEDVPVYFLQQLACNNGNICDFSNTAQMSLILPSDVSYTSDSGVFLTQSASTPEPCSIMLLGLGLAAVGCLRRRQGN
ncbi:MAG: PEP-CTERM sorting domain-containing protein [Bryobacteraceae bacterium]